MKRLARWWRAWVALMSRKERGDAMALFRIATGVVVVWVLAGLLATGLVDILWVDRAHGGYRALGSGPYLVRWLGGPTPGVIHGLTILTIVGGCAVILGLGGRLSAFVTLQGYIALQRLDGNASGSSDILVTNALWLLVLARSTATLSVDCKLRTGSFWSEEEISAFPRYLGILQLVVMYWATGMQKVSVYWFPAGSYSALYYILQQPTWQRFSMTWAARVYPLTQVSTAVTWLWEVSAPLLVLVYYFRYTAERGGRLRRWANRWDLRLGWAAVGVMLHLLIFTAMDVGHFSQISLCFYVCVLHPDELRRLYARVADRARHFSRRSDGDVPSADGRSADRADGPTR
ncbi:MAG: HTTM domain-containing protein [Polyangiaceae bacterium]